MSARRSASNSNCAPVPNAGWRLLPVELAAGVGVDRYVSHARVRLHDDPVAATRVDTVAIDLANTRTLLFADAGVRLPALRLVAEVGYQAGKDQHLATRFSDFDPTAGHVFGSVGVRVGF